MLRRPTTSALLLPLLLLALAGCSQVNDTASRAGDCVGLVRDVAEIGLSGTPTVEDAEAAVRTLDDRVTELDDPEVREATAAVRDRLRELADAARSGDTAAAQDASSRARDAARTLASTCGVPVDQVLGGSAVLVEPSSSSPPSRGSRVASATATGAAACSASCSRSAGSARG